MPVIDITKDLDACTMTVTARLAASVERSWQLVSDPRQLERWWGPPTYPATVTQHDLTPGGTVAYSMTGPEGDQHHGYWKVVTANPPHALEVLDGFAHDDGTPNDEMPTTVMRMTFEADGDSCLMKSFSQFPSVEAMKEMVEMGMEEGIRAAIGQIDDLLAVQPA